MKGQSEFFLKNFKPANLPLVIKPCKFTSSGLPQFVSENAIPDESGFVPYVRFNDTENFLAVISLGMANCATPLLTTYDKKGNKIDEKLLSIGACNEGQAIDCEETVIIRSDWSIFVSDTILNNNLDDKGNPMKDSIANFVIYREGTVLQNGSIKLLERKKQILWNH